MLHGILHRIEGDYDNTRAWYRDVQDSEVFRLAWGEGGLNRALEFVRRIEVLRKSKGSDGTEKEKEREGLQQESKREIVTVIEYCESTFGTGRVEDASDLWVQDEKSSAQGNDMVVGREGRRQF